MEQSTLLKRINDKEIKIAKLQVLLAKYLKNCDAEEVEAINQFLQTGDRSAYKTYLKNHNLFYGGDAWSKANEYYDSLNTLQKYQNQLKAEEAKSATLNELPSVLIEFKNNLIKYWDSYDEWKQKQIRTECSAAEKLPYEEYRKAISEIRQRWGIGWRDFYHLSIEQIHNSNVKDADNLVLNLVNRTSEICGKITDASGLYFDRDNNGYSIINGLIIGENGRCRVESIGAGGYNIQRFHIRVLVKPVK